jgi:hypothetical protein
VVSSRSSLLWDCKQPILRLPPQERLCRTPTDSQPFSPATQKEPACSVHWTVHTGAVYTRPMKNITLSADGDLIEKARAVAKSENRTLNAAFREWLVSYTRQEAVRARQELMKRLQHIDAGGPYTREEMNER